MNCVVLMVSRTEDELVVVNPWSKKAEEAVMKTFLPAFNAVVKTVGLITADPVTLMERVVPLSVDVQPEPLVPVFPEVLMVRACPKTSTLPSTATNAAKPTPNNLFVQFFIPLFVFLLIFFRSPQI